MTAATAKRAALPAVVVLLAAVKCLLWSLSLPPWYGPDEPAHFAYVQMLAVAHVVPYGSGTVDGTLPPDVMCSEARLGFRSNGGFFAEPAWGPDRPPPCPAPTGDPRLPATRGSTAGDYLPVYYGLGALAWEAAASQSVETRLHAVRAVSALLGVLATAFTYLAAFWIFRGRQAPAAAAALLFAFQPMASQQFAIVSNDALLVAGGAAFFWLWARALVKGASDQGLAWLGLVGGLCYLAKPQGAFLLAVAPLPLVLGNRALWKSGSSFWLPLLRGLIPVWSAGAVPVAAGVVFSLLVHGSAGPHAAPVQPGPHGVFTFLHLYLDNSANHVYFLLISTFWGNFAWLSVPTHVPILVGIVTAYALAAAGLVIGVWRRRLVGQEVLALVLAGAVVTVLVMLLQFVYYRVYGIEILQGRSFFFLLPVLAILLTGGLYAWLPRRWLGVASAGVFLLALLVNVLSLLQLWSYLYR